jgi:glyoxylate reductase
MSNKILVTDSLFIHDEHVKRLEEAGFEVERLDKPNPTIDELRIAIQGKAGYLLGGIERVNESIIDAADELKVISALAVGYEWFIPAWEYATKKGIAITNTPGGPTNQVAEWAVAAALAMNREIFDLGRSGKKTFAVTKGIEGKKIGIIGVGSIGTRIGEMLQQFRPSKIYYFSRSRKFDQEKQLQLQFLELPKLLAQCDIVFLTVSDEAQNFFTSNEFGAMKDSALLVNPTHPGIVNEKDLLDALKKKRIRAISDYPMSIKEFDELPISDWYCMNGSNTLTEAGVRLMSDMATDSIINVLKTGNDKYKVN